MVDIYVVCGEWISNDGPEFVDDKERGGRLLVLKETTTLEELHSFVSKDFRIDQRQVTIVCSFVPGDLLHNSRSPPVIITSDTQVSNFVAYVTRKPTTQLCVTCKPRVQTGMNKEAVKETRTRSRVSKNPVSDAPHEDNKAHVVRGTNQLCLANAAKKGQRFYTKRMLKARMEICAMKHNFDYKVVKSTKKWWYIRCCDDLCNWRLRASSVDSTTVFIVTKYVSTHTCAPSSKTKGGKTAYAKTIASLIIPKFKAGTPGPSPVEIIQCMHLEQGVNISYSLAYDAHEYAVNTVRGIPEKSYEKIPKYLYMLQEANPGTHYSFVTYGNDKFKFLFLSFGQSIRGFETCVRKVVIVDGTFLKNKYKGVLLVATAVDGNNNLYPLAFGVVDLENDLSWDWFMRQLRVVIPDEDGLVFVSDRCTSILKSVGNVFPQATHGMCIHHLLNNVVTGYQGKGLVALVADASKVYTEVEFEKLFQKICNRSAKIGKYLTEADVSKWARCYFPGFRYDIRTNNPAESINAALKAPREYPLIPLLDSIREMLSRWFNERRTLSQDHRHPLTIEVEKKIARRIEKGKTFIVEQLNDDRFHVRGDEMDCLVDLNERTCTCRKYDLIKIPCRHAIKAGLSVGREPHSLTDDMYKTVTWRATYAETIQPIAVPEEAWRVPMNVDETKVLPPETKQQAGRRKKRRFEGPTEKLRKVRTGAIKKTRTNKCSRCHRGGHNRRSCTTPI